MKMIKRLVFCVICCLLLSLGSVYAEEYYISNDFEYILNDEGNAIIRKFHGYGKFEVTIPDKLDGYARA